jgi:hypothetical protein
MVDHLLIAALMAMVAQGAYASQQEGMILHVLTKAWMKLPTFFHKPTFTCPVCMVSVWGIPTALLLGAEPMMLPVYLLAAAGINAVVTQ